MTNYMNELIINENTYLHTKRLIYHLYVYTNYSYKQRRKSTLGMQSISYYPKDEFGKPDRSTWEPRRNNWNQ